MSNDTENIPKGTRSKKGRPRKHRLVSTGSQFRKVAKEKISIEVGGTRVRMSLWEAYVRQVYTMSLTNAGFASLLNRLRKQFPGNLLPGDPITYLITEEDANV